MTSTYLFLSAVHYFISLFDYKMSSTGPNLSVHDCRYRPVAHCGY